MVEGELELAVSQPIQEVTPSTPTKSKTKTETSSLFSVQDVPTGNEDSEVVKEEKKLADRQPDQHFQEVANTQNLNSELKNSAFLQLRVEIFTRRKTFTTLIWLITFLHI